jgi:hypothetical protein
MDNGELWEVADKVTDSDEARERLLKTLMVVRDAERKRCARRLREEAANYFRLSIKAGTENLAITLKTIAGAYRSAAEEVEKS